MSVGISIIIFFVLVGYIIPAMFYFFGPFIGWLTVIGLVSPILLALTPDGKDIKHKNALIVFKSMLNSIIVILDIFFLVSFFVPFPIEQFARNLEHTVGGMHGLAWMGYVILIIPYHFFALYAIAGREPSEAKTKRSRVRASFAKWICFVFWGLVLFYLFASLASFYRLY